MRSGLRALLNAGITRSHFTAIFAGLSRHGHIILTDVKTPMGHLPYTWVAQGTWKGPLHLPGDEVEFEASIAQYDRLDGSVDYGLAEVVEI